MIEKRNGWLVKPVLPSTFDGLGQDGWQKPGTMLCKSRGVACPSASMTQAASMAEVFMRSGEAWHMIREAFHAQV
jgi:hypothetical protein